MRERSSMGMISLFFRPRDLRNPLTPLCSLSLSLSLPPRTRPHHHVGPDDLEVPDPLHGIRVAGEFFSFSFETRRSKEGRGRNPTLETKLSLSLSLSLFLFLESLRSSSSSPAPWSPASTEGTSCSSRRRRRARRSTRETLSCSTSGGEVSCFNFFLSLFFSFFGSERRENSNPKQKYSPPKQKI